ncbi:uncharacterized protein TRAVEDRAFT_41203 [Trametes versicolor FP-101664 SS1]|uniref:uncharacterized protein n=1 Tax=Trametes versicolor (strain FP-101664) TaxID=717944 RepID=UPI0004623F12|nr:uncharacterized protein TRAVEDRAFT_41203 [Trametes versicolor FP-101664 SS1]EIW63775.1 hypothetical protein TRAVEDRAFT_41203 [Trametes versicolor FP-101664 SS1]
MAHAWPRLTILSICQEHLRSETDGVTLAALRDLVEQRPALTELDVALAPIKRGDCEEVIARPLHTRAERDGHILGPLQECRLCTIGIGAPWLEREDVAAVAAALNAIFPHLTGIIHDGVGPVRSIWWGMEKRLAMFRKVREQERKYALGQTRYHTS